MPPPCPTSSGPHGSSGKFIIHNVMIFNSAKNYYNVLYINRERIEYHLRNLKKRKFKNFLYIKQFYEQSKKNPKL